MSAHSVAAIAAFEGLLVYAGETVTIGSTEYQGQVSEIPYDSGLIDGGTAEAQTYKVKLRLSDFPTNPDKFTAVIAKGKSLQVMSSTRNNGHLEIICGDPASEN